MKHPARRRFSMLAHIVLACAILAGCSRKSEVPGVYLAQGGQDCYEIEKSFWGGFRIKEPIKTNLFQSRWQVEFNEGRLRLSYIQGDAPLQYQMQYELIPSATVAGDWDLIAFTMGIPPGGDVPALETPVPSFLHRVEDRRVILYFEEIGRARSFERQPDAERLFDLANQLLSVHPDDLYVRRLYLGALVNKRNLSELEGRLADWRSEYENSDDALLALSFRYAEEAFSGLRLSAAGRNAYNRAAEVFGPEANLRKQIDAFPEILNYDEFIWPYGPYAGRILPSYSDMQASLKVFRVQAIFLLLQGNREEALDLLAASCHLGLMLNANGALINRIIGSAFSGIGRGGLDIYALNACETAQDFDALWEVLGKLKERQEQLKVEDLESVISPLEWTERDESMTRLRERNARLYNLCVGAAARHRLLSGGQFPRTADELAPLLPEGLPKDPLSPEPMKFFALPESFTCYSIGPDEEDDRAEVVYDPTNGTFSRGDIVLEVPRERRFPFPRNGVRAASLEDFWKRFPNGLPLDPFGPKRAPDREGSLQVSNTTPVYVYSRGPDLDVDTGDSMERFVPENHYDPTNGTFSSGDLFIQIPR